MGSPNVTIQYSAYDFLFTFYRKYVLYCFRDTAGYLSKVADFSYPMCILRPISG